MTIPPLFLNQSLSLFHDKRNPARATSSSIMDLSFYIPQGYENSPLPRSFDQIASNYNLMYKHMVSLAKTTRAFHGAPRRSTGPDSNACTCVHESLEVAPHDTVHSWVGNLITKQCPCPSKTCYGEDMGVFYSAARDPIFYPHHANIDRLWTVWRKLPGRKDYTDPDLLETRFFFYDENKRLVSVRAGDAYDPEKLRYTYEASPAPRLQKPEYDKIPPALPPLACDPVQECRSPHDIQFFHPVKIGLPRRPARSRFSRFMAGEELLLVEGIRVQRNLAVKFDIFVYLDDRLVSTSYVDSVPREYAGKFVELPRGVRDEVEGRCGQSSLCLGISEVLRDLNVEEEENIFVTLVLKIRVEIPIRVSCIRLEYSGREILGVNWNNFLSSRWGLCPPLDVYPA